VTLWLETQLKKKEKKKKGLSLQEGRVQEKRGMNEQKKGIKGEEASIGCL